MTEFSKNMMQKFNITEEMYVILLYEHVWELCEPLNENTLLPFEINFICIEYLVNDIFKTRNVKMLTIANNLFPEFQKYSRICPGSKEGLMCTPQITFFTINRNKKTDNNYSRKGRDKFRLFPH